MSRARPGREGREALLLLGVLVGLLLPQLGQVPAWAAAAGLAMLAWRAVLAWRGGALPSRRGLAALLVLGVGATLAQHGGLLGQAPGRTLLVLLLGLKTLEWRARRDAGVLHGLGFFLALGVFFDGQGPGRALLVLAGVAGLLTSMLLAHRPSGEVPLREALAETVGLLARALPLALLLFLAVPRLGPLWGEGLGARTGLAGELALGSLGPLSLDDSLAATLEPLDGQPLPPAEALYLRGPVLERFDGQRWLPSRSSFPPELRPELALEPRGPARRLRLQLEAPRLALLPLPEATPSLQAPPGSPPNRLPPGLAPRLDEALVWRLGRALDEGLRLDLEVWPAHRHGPREPRVGLQDMIELPPGHNPRLLGLAAALRRDPAFTQADARQLSAELLRRLREGGFRYTLDPPDLGDPRTALDTFWFDTRAGFCEHHAAAFVVLMRALDVPARLVLGYQGGEPDPAAPQRRRFLQRHAHAWAEVWQPEAGWLRVDPTAAIAPARTGRGETLAPPPGPLQGALAWLHPTLPGRLAGWGADLEAGWRRWAAGYGPARQAELAEALARPGVLALVLVGLGLAAALARRRRGAAGGPARARQALWAAARRAGLSPAPGWTLRRLGEALEARHGTAAAPARASLARLEALRHGPARAGAARPAWRAEAQAWREACRAVRRLPANRPPPRGAAGP